MTRAPSGSRVFGLLRNAIHGSWDWADRYRATLATFARATNKTLSNFDQITAGLLAIIVSPGRLGKTGPDRYEHCHNAISPWRGNP